MNCESEGVRKLAPVVQTINLHKTYMLGKVPVNALRGVDLEIESGDFVAIVGPSGSGKSTLLNLIGALDRPTEGKVIIDGVDVSTLNDDELAELRRRIGFVFQFFNLIPRLTASENVELPLAIAGVKKRQRKEKTSELLKAVGLSERAGHNPTELSGGEQQRVAIARALANEPRFLLLDEPTGNIDSKTADMLILLLRKLNEERGVTIIMITHDLNIAKQAKRIVRILDGRIIEETSNIAT
ncbi:ABC transporter ATP-binding protein [Candidatus Bathyarchaeota archaeon]|nr:ABC transporter ATP-binding protein [Candidatus Bathyarchaeota archaeon]